MPLAINVSTSEIGVPSIHSMVMTVRLQKSKYTLGTMSMGLFSNWRPNWLALAASCIKSNSSCRYLSNSCTTSRGFKRLPSRNNFSNQTAPQCIKAKSCSITGLMSGRKTLTATFLPCEPSSLNK